MCASKELNLCLLVSSTDNLCKQFGPRAVQTKGRAWTRSKLLNTLMIILKFVFEKVNLEKNQQMAKKHVKLTKLLKMFVLTTKKHTKLHSMQRVKWSNSLAPHFWLISASLEYRWLVLKHKIYLPTLKPPLNTQCWSISYNNGIKFHDNLIYTQRFQTAS